MPQAFRDAVCRTMVCGVGPNYYRALVDRFGSPTAVLDASISRLRGVMGMGLKLAESIGATRSHCDVEGELEAYSRLDVQVILGGTTWFPEMLSTVSGPPALIFVRGSLLPRDTLAVAIVGSRRCTHYGVRQTERLSAALSRIGFTIVNGLAQGIDASAHRGALLAGGRTIVVLASELDNIYPAENKELVVRISDFGALISEMPTGGEPIGALFPQRNRIISGLNSGVLIVEAAERSGAMITVRHSLEQNRAVFALPGPVDNLVSRGCHQLLRDGAHLVETDEDVLDALGSLMIGIHPVKDIAVRHLLGLTLNGRNTSRSTD